MFFFDCLLTGLCSSAPSTTELSSVKAIISGGGPLLPNVIQQFDLKCPQVPPSSHPHHGQTLPSRGSRPGPPSNFFGLPPLPF